MGSPTWCLPGFMLTPHMGVVKGLTRLGKERVDTDRFALLPRELELVFNPSTVEQGLLTLIMYGSFFSS